MSLTRFLPTPSDRMGILWTLLTVKDSVVLEYGPAGTTHFSVGLFGSLGESVENRLFTTHMSEDDVVMGDVTRLEKAILEIDKKYSPNVIFVVSSSVAAVIGSDIKGVCSYMQEKVNAKLISFEQGGFRGDYSTGIAETYRLLVNELAVEDVKEKEETYNIIGLSMGSYRAESDLNELKYLLRKSFGLEARAVLCGDVTTEEIGKMGSAAVNIVLREEGVKAAKILESRYGTPIVAGSPYGYKGTLEWLEKVGKAIGKEISKDVRKELEERIADTAYYPMYTMMLMEDRPSVSLVGEYRTILGIGQFINDLGFNVDNKISCHSLKSVSKPDPSVIVCKTEKERLDILKNLHKSFILGDDASMSVCADDNVFLRISMPIINGKQIAKHLPLMGLHGADLIMEKLEEYYQTLH